MDHPPRIEKRMPRGYCGFVGENLGTKHLESFAASLKMLHLFDNLGLVDIILYICILCVYIYVCVCGCVCVHVCSCLSHAEIGKPSIPYTSFCGVADHGHCLLFHSGLLSFYSIYFDHAVIVMLTFPYIDIHHYSAFCNIYI